MKRVLTLGIAALALGITAEVQAHTSSTHASATAAASASRPPRDRISSAAARKIALHRVRGGHVKASELEKEQGRWVYSFDIVEPGRAGVRELWIDARTGAVRSDRRETPKAEREEARVEAKEKGTHRSP